MFAHIIRYDWLLLRTSRLLLIGFSLFAFFVAFALWNGHQRVSFQKQTLLDIRKAEAKKYAELKQTVADIQKGVPYAGSSWTNPTDPFAIGYGSGSKYAALPPAALAIIATGQSDLLPYYYKPTFTKMQSLYHGEEIENATVLYNGSFDLAFVIVYLLPLLIIGLTYNIISSEKEQGTLSMLLTGHTSFRAIALSKYVFRFLLLNTAFVCLLIGGLVLTGTNLLQALSETAFLLLLTILYAAFWFSLSFLVNSHGKDSGYNAAILVASWLVFVLVIPTLLSVAANTLHPVPSRVELITKVREASDQANKEKAKLLSQYLEDHPELVPKGQQTDSTRDDWAMMYVRTQMEVDKAILPIETQFDEQLGNQQAIIKNYRLLSPAIFVGQTLNDVAGTDENHYRDFRKQAFAYYQAFQGYFVGKIFRQEKMQPSDFDTIPTFHYEKPAAKTATPANLVNMVFLGVFSAVFVWLGFAKAEKIRLVSA